MPAVDPVYDDPATPAEMAADCLAAEAYLSFPHDRIDVIARAASRPVPSLRFEDFPREAPKPELHPAVVAQRIAAALELDLD